MPVSLAAALALLAAAAPGELDRWRRQARAVTITRDDRGIAHVVGRTDADAVFGMMFAQAEDDFERVEMNYLVALGRLAEAEGEPAVWQDLRARLYLDEADLRARYRGSPAWLRALMDAHAAGLNFFLATHPGVKPRAITRFEPWMVLSFTEGSIGADIERVSLAGLRALYGAAADQGAALPPEERFDRTQLGSNGIAIAPARSASGRALLLINPHTTFYFRSEQHVRSGEGLDVYGAGTWGQFFIYQGFNRHCGWMHTSSGADVVDEFKERLVERAGRTLYVHGKDERPLGSRKVTIKVKSPAGGLTERTFTVLSTHHGPAVRREGADLVTFAMMFRPVEALTQSFLRTKARGLASFLAVSEQKANSTNNTVFADADGHIAYLHPQFVPRRDDRFDFTRPVDGADPATGWQGLHAATELPSAIDPPVGHVVNTNDWPYSAAGPDSPRRETFPRYMDTAGPNARGAHAAALLTAARFSLDSLLAAAFDAHLPAFARLVPLLIGAHEDLPHADPLRARLDGPVQVLRRWDHRWAADSVPTTLAVLWGDEVRSRFPPPPGDALPFVEHLATRVPAAARLDALAVVVARLEQDWGTWRVKWSEVNRLQRRIPHDDALPSVGVPFTASRWGSLAAFEAARAPGTRRLYGRAGNSFVAVVEFGPTPTAVAVSVGGSSGDPASPHHTDQDELYVTGALRPVYFTEEQLKGHTVRSAHPGD